MKRKPITLFLILLISAIVLGVCARKTKESNHFTYPPNVMVDDVVYWFSRSYIDPSLIKGFDFVGVVSENKNGIAAANFSANGVAVGAEIYKSEKYPGWLYVKWNEYINRFTVWELSYPLIRYDGSIYVAANEFRNSMAGNKVSQIHVKDYSDNYEVVGTLDLGESDAVPKNNFEVNTEVYLGQKLYCNPNDTSTIYADAQHGETRWRDAFYRADLIPIAYENFVFAD